MCAKNKNIIVFFLSILPIFSTFCVSAQSTKVDSLNTAINLEKSNSKKTTLLNQLSIILIDSNLLDSALSTVHTSLILETKSLVPSVKEAKCYLIIAEIHSKSARYDLATNYYSQAIPILKKFNDPLGLSAAYAGIGITNYYKGDYNSSMKAYSKSLELREELGDRRRIAASLNNIGLVHFKLQEYELAKKYFFKSLKIKENDGLVIGISFSCNNLGDVFLAQKEYDEALFYYERALKIRTDLNEQNLIAYSFNSIGKLYTEMENYKWGQDYYQKSIEIKQKLNDKQGISATLVEIAKLDIKRKEYLTAHKNAIKALLIATDIAALPLEQECYKYLSEISEKQNRPFEALLYFKKYTMIKDSLQNAKLVNEIETQYQVNKKQLEINHQKQLNLKQRENAKKQATRQRLLIAGIFLLLLLSVIFIRNIKQKKKANYQLAMRNAEVEQQKEEINTQNEEISEKNETLLNHKNKITSSIEYARHIQTAILPSSEFITTLFKEYFILYLPKEIVSGDYYWFKKIKNFTIGVVADCTGHGVHGAFMSMLGSSFLNEIITPRSLDNAGQHLDKLRLKVKKALKQTGEMGKNQDGMDISFFIIDNETLKLQFAGAYNPLLIVRNNVLTVLKADRQPVSVYSHEKPFTTQYFQLEKNDCIYAFSDGFANQLGGEKQKIYKTSNFKKLLRKNANLPMKKQKEILTNEFNSWKDKLQQVDDVLVLGIKV